MKRVVGLYLLVFLYSFAKGQSISGIINSYHKVTEIFPATNSVKVANASGLNANDNVLIIQMKGAAINENNNSSFGDISAINGAGQYEYATICAILTDTVMFKTVLVNSYDVNSDVQLVKIPNYTDVIVTDTLKAQAWDESSGTGGVLALMASGTITLNSGVTADGNGFEGGIYYNYTSSCTFLTNITAYFNSNPPVIGENTGGFKGKGVASIISGKEIGRGKQANGGGGGNNHDAGGGGGANYGSGGIGGKRIASAFSCQGDYPGVGGASLSGYGYTISPGLNKIFMGGGGGAGYSNGSSGTSGGNGGGIIFIKAGTLVGNNHTISSSGTRGYNALNGATPYEANGDGGGGGGAGGTVLLYVSSYSGNVTVEAKGGDGSYAGFQNQCPGPGGGGGGGVVWLNSASVPGNISSNVSGGANGLVKYQPSYDPSCELQSNGATPGNSGAVLTNLLIPEGVTFNCSTVLPVSPLVDFIGNESGNTIHLSWTLERSETLSTIILQRSINNDGFKDISRFAELKDTTYSFSDPNADKDAAYRLLLIYDGGSQKYSAILYFKRKNSLRALSVYPNPAKGDLVILLPQNRDSKIEMMIYDVSGKLVMNKTSYTASNTISLSVRSFNKGMYFIRVNTPTESFAGKFFKE